MLWGWSWAELICTQISGKRFPRAHTRLDVLSPVWNQSELDTECPQWLWKPLWVTKLNTESGSSSAVAMQGIIIRGRRTRCLSSPTAPAAEGPASHGRDTAIHIFDIWGSRLKESTASLKRVNNSANPEILRVCRVKVTCHPKPYFFNVMFYVSSTTLQVK